MGDCVVVNECYAVPEDIECFRFGSTSFYIISTTTVVAGRNPAEKGTLPDRLLRLRADRNQLVFMDRIGREDGFVWWI